MREVFSVEGDHEHEPEALDGKASIDLMARFAIDLYADLRRVAASYLRHHQAGFSIQPTILVHESFLRLVERARVRPADREHFFALSATIMRQVLVDHARKRRTRSNGRFQTAMRLASSQDLSRAEDTRLLEVDAALSHLAERDPRQAKIVELRFFGGLDTNAIAAHLGVSRRTVELDWRMAKAFLNSFLSSD